MTDVTACTGYKMTDTVIRTGLQKYRGNKNMDKFTKMNNIKTWTDVHNYRRKHMDMFTK